MKSYLPLVLVAVVALAAGVWFGLDRPTGEPRPQTGALVLESPRDPGAFELVDHLGRPFTPAELQDRWTLWFFGFTNCPDVCPMTLAALNETDALLDAAQARRPDVIMVSVDPARDTPERLAGYVPYFNARFTGVTGSAAEIRKLTERVGILVRYVAGEGDDYTVDHGASLALVGPDGTVRAMFPSPHRPERLARDLAVLIPWLESR